MRVDKLRPTEVAQVDTLRLEEICEKLGEIGGESAICAAMEDLAELLHRAEGRWRADDIEALELSSRQIASLADRLGMAKLNRVAGDVVGLCNSFDSTARAATVARMRRLGEGSLLAIWDVQDMTV